MDLREYRAAAHILAARYKTPESILKDKVIALLLKTPGVDVIRFNTGQASYGGRKVRFGYPGMADIYARVTNTKCNPCKRTLWIELKAGSKQSDAQIAFEEKTKKWGDHYAIVTNIQDAIDAIEKVRQ